MGNKQFIKKTIELDEEAIKKLRRIFEVNTDKEAVNRAMHLVLEEEEIIQTHQVLAGSIALQNPFS